MSTTQQLMTAQDLLELPGDGMRHELVKGELRTMAPAGFEHGAISNRLAVRMTQYVEKHRLGTAVGPETGFLIERDPDTVRSPDAAFISRRQLDEHGIPKEYFPAAPDLAVEVISPSDVYEEVEEKVADWLAAGTKLVWVVNPRQRTVSVHRGGPQVRVLREGDDLDGEDVVPGFRCRVGELFL